MLKASQSVGLDQICLKTDLPHLLPPSLPLYPVIVPWKVDLVAEALVVEWHLPMWLICGLTWWNAIRIFRL